MTRPPHSIAPAPARLVATISCALALALLPACKNHQPSDNLGRAEPASPPAPRVGWLRQKAPAPRFEELDSSRYSGVAAKQPPSAPGLPDVALMQTETLEHLAPEGSAAVVDDHWRPEWWSDKPVRDEGEVRVCAMGEAPDLLAARKKALELARDMLKRELAGARPPDVPATKADSVRMPDGRYRAFVRLAARPPAR